MATATAPRRTERKPLLSEHLFAPRFWVGMNMRAWGRLLWNNRFAIDWPYCHVAAAVTGWSAVNSVWGMLQRLSHGRRLAEIELTAPPIFVLGHWRSGTTLLHEMMVLDERHSFPTTYACLAPNHFLRSEPLVSRWFSFVLPTRRPMDNMAAGWDRPQEDEFALCNLGVPSPYLTVAFPNHAPQCQDYLTLENLPTAEVDRWKASLLGFLKQVTLANPKRLVLKSPPHTARIKTLLEMFPDARFVHLVRDPHVVFPSTVNLWKTLYTRHGLQRPKFAGLDEHVFSTFERMYTAFNEQRHLVPPEHFCEVRYEDLVRNPLGEMQTIYEHLGLGGFDRVQPGLESYIATMEGYQTNRYQITPEQTEEISHRWGPFMRPYGYEL